MFELCNDPSHWSVIKQGELFGVLFEFVFSGEYAEQMRQQLINGFHAFLWWRTVAPCKGEVAPGAKGFRDSTVRKSPGHLGCFAGA